MRNTYDIFTRSMLVGVHLYSPSLKVELSGRTESNSILTVSPSESKVDTVKIHSSPTVTLNVLSTVIFGLALAAKIR